MARRFRRAPLAIPPAHAVLNNPFSNATARDRVILALDVPDLAGARKFAESIAVEVGMIKVGLELFVEAGRDAVKIGEHVKLPVFLDLKLHDIPETVDRAVARACSMGVALATVHASGGTKMLERAVRRSHDEKTGLTIVAVTVLTSFDDADLAKIGCCNDVATQSKQLARVAFAAGVRAFVCSPHEAKTLREQLGTDAILITPGVRLSETDDDQKRVATPDSAIAAGADAIVVGRPIRDASDPVKAAREIVSLVERGMKS